MQSVILVHGFADDNGKHTTDKLRPFFERASFAVREFDYGWTGLLGVRLLNGRRAKKLAQLAREIKDGPVIGVGHSNGCAVLRRATFEDAPFEKLIFISPALNRSATVGPQVKRIHVLHSPFDAPVRIARWLPWHEWGDMGAVGYEGPDERFVNHRKDRDYLVSSWGHLDLFTDRKISFFGPLIVDLVLDTKPAAEDTPQ